jgi:hypothetical protein
MRFAARLFALLAIGVPVMGTLSACQTLDSPAGQTAVAAGCASAVIVRESTRGEDLSVRVGAAAAQAIICELGARP